MVEADTSGACLGVRRPDVAGTPFHPTAITKDPPA
jgi:hypothetical protein